MKTYKFLAVALIATGVFSACTNDPVVQPVKRSDPAEISFRLQGGTPEITTRSSATTLLDVDAFAVFGIDDLADNGGAGANIMHGVTVARQVGGFFDYSPKKYFSEGAADAQFFAYSPVSAIQHITNLPAATSSAYTGASFDFKVVKPSTSGKISQVDLLVAGSSVEVTTTPVDLQFTHALSRVFVKAVNELNDDIVITNLKLLNLKSDGKLTGTAVTASDPADPWTWAWAPIASSTTNFEYVLAPTGVALKAGAGKGSPNVPILVTSMEQGMLVLPQKTVNNNGPDDASAGDFALEVTYDLVDLIGETAYIYLTHDYEFKMNQQYAITITFSGSTRIVIDFEIDVDDFNNILDLP